MAIGRRKKGDFDFVQAGQQALIEGIASPVAGFTLAGIGKAGIESVKGVGRITGKGLEKTKIGRGALKAGEQAAQYINSRKNYLLPFGGVDDVTQRNFEAGRAIFKEIKADMKKPKNIQGLFYPTIKNKKYVYVNDNYYGKLKYI